jgi:DNA (cytosine-5)-methyltransferase 1
VDHTEEQRIISFCTGYGGIERGIERAGVNVRTVAACEIETYAIANLVDKMEEGSLQPFPVWSDVKTFDGKPFCDKVHGIIAGYPCQPFSQAGKRQGVEDPRHLWLYIQKHIETIKPIWAFFENVSGHITMGFDEVCRSLWDMGYNVEAGMFTASECGAPHQRKRLFILADSDSSRSAEDRQPAELWAGGVKQSPGNCGKTDTGKDDKRQWPSRPGQPQELADTVREGLQGAEQPGGVKVKEWHKQIGPVAKHGEVWPSRPGQEQFVWESPRTLKPGLGRAVNGAAATMDANRVDRLRLLGNGVVPQTVELAWNTLWGQILTQKVVNNEEE